MNEWQALQQIRYRLRAATWPSAGVKIFGNNVIVTAGPHEDALSALNLPFCLIRPGNAENDPAFVQEPSLITLRLQVRIAQSIPGDAAGENVVLGANRLTESASGGKGLLEIQEEFYRQVRILNVEDALDMKWRAASALEAAMVEGMGYVAFRDYSFEAQVVFDRFYPPALSLQATAIGGGQVSLSWKVPPDRFDRYRVILRRAAGSTPPSSIIFGTGVTLSGNLATSVTDTTGAGTFSYSLFATYDDRSAAPSMDLQVSSSLTKTLVVT